MRVTSDTRIREGARRILERGKYATNLWRISLAERVVARKGGTSVTEAA